MPDAYCLVFCTCPDAATARTLAAGLVEERLAACVNVLPGLTSIYGWEGQVETTEEHLLIIKTARHGYPRLQAVIGERHPYAVPEIVAVPIEAGNPSYLAWIGQWLRGEG